MIKPALPFPLCSAGKLLCGYDRHLYKIHLSVFYPVYCACNHESLFLIFLYLKKAMPETTVYKTNGNVGFLEYIALNEYHWLMNAFSTRQGGVSAGQYSEMNLSFTVGDSPEKVRENYRIFREAIGVKCEEMVFSAQTHTDNVMRVDSFHKGMGISRDRDFNNIDGLITSEPAGRELYQRSEKRRLI